MSQEALIVLQEILDILTDPTSGCALDVPPCRVGVYPGIEVPWDTCGSSCGSGDGQLWANLTGADVVQDPPCHRITFNADIGILRCAAPMNDDGSPPSMGRVVEDAVRQAIDADAIRNAITCCEARSEAVRGIVLVSWTALGPEGGCVGGSWSVRGIVTTCC